MLNTSCFLCVELEKWACCPANSSKESRNSMWDVSMAGQFSCHAILSLITFYKKWHAFQFLSNSFAQSMLRSKTFLKFHNHCQKGQAAFFDNATKQSPVCSTYIRETYTIFLRTWKAYGAYYWLIRFGKAYGAYYWLIRFVKVAVLGLRDWWILSFPHRSRPPWPFPPPPYLLLLFLFDNLPPSRGIVDSQPTR